MADETISPDAVQRLHERVDRLERIVGAAGSDGGIGGVAARSPDVFWPLSALQQRLPDPGGVLYVGSVTLPDGQHAEWQLGRDTTTILERDWTAPAISTALAALGNPVRLRMLQAIATGSTSVGELVELEGVGTTGQVYHHVNQLVAAGWVRSVGRGKYSVPLERVVPLLTVLLASGGTS